MHFSSKPSAATTTASLIRRRSALLAMVTASDCVATTAAASAAFLSTTHHLPGAWTSGNPVLTAAANAAVSPTTTTTTTTIHSFSPSTLPQDVPVDKDLLAAWSTASIGTRTTEETTPSGDSFSSSSVASSSLDSVAPLSAEHSLRDALGVVAGEGSIHPRPVPVGHRGSLYKALENTREAFDECARMGCPSVELDVFLLKCGTLVVFHGGGTDEHPGELDDYCGVHGSILDYTYEEALGLAFNPLYREFGCPEESIRRGRIPTLEEVLLDAQKTGLNVKIELKGEGTVEPTLDLVERLGMTKQCSYSSFDLPRLRLLRELRPDRAAYPTGALFDEVPEDYLKQARDCGATEVHLRYDTCTRARVDEIHAGGFGSMLWMRGPIGMARDCRESFLDVGNEDESMYLALLQTGVQQLCVNRPDVLLEVCQQLQLGSLLQAA